MRRALLATALLMVLAAAGSAAADHRPDADPGGSVDVGGYGAEAAGLTTGQQAPEGLDLGSADVGPLPAEAALSVHGPAHLAGAEETPATEADLTLRHASTLASPTSPEPARFTFEAQWVKEPGLEEGGNRDEQTRVWRVHLSATVLGEPLELEGQWVAQDYFTICTDDSQHSYCYHNAAGVLDLTGTRGLAEVSLDGELHDRYCTVPPDDRLNSPTLGTRKVVSC